MTRDEYLEVLATEPLTPNQRGAIMRECERLGLIDRAERLAVLAELLELDELCSTADLVMGQAGQLINVLRHTRDRAGLARAAAVPAGQGDEHAESARPPHGRREPVGGEPRGDWPTRVAVMARWRPTIAAMGVTFPGRACEQCGAPIPPGRRASARTCSNRCRSALYRGRRRRSVTGNGTGQMIAAVTDIRPAVPVTWEPVIEPRHPYETPEQCPGCGALLYASARGTWRACPACSCSVTPAAVAGPYEHGSQRQVVSQRERDLEALRLAGRKGIMLGQLRRLAEAGLDDETRLKAEWFAEQVRAAASGARLDELAALFAEAGIRDRPVLPAAGYDYGEEEDGGYGPVPPPVPRLAIAPPPAAEPDWQWALRELGWDVSIPLQRSPFCHVTQRGAGCCSESMHNIGARYGAQVWVCDSHYRILTRTIAAALRR